MQRRNSRGNTRWEALKDVVGHKDILKYISSAVENNRVSHAYILNGERGSGKKMLANLFAMTLFCVRPGTMNRVENVIPASRQRVAIIRTLSV